MINKRNKAIIEGAFIGCFSFLFSMINLITGSFFDFIFIYIIALMFYLYRKKYDMTMTLAVYITVGVIILLSGQLFFLLFILFTAPSGIYLGYAKKNKNKIGSIKIVISIINFIKYYLLFHSFSALFGVESMLETIMMMVDIDYSIVFLSMVCTFYFISFIETIVFLQYANILDRYLMKKKG